MTGRIIACIGFAVTVTAVITAGTHPGMTVSHADEPKTDAPRVILMETWNGVTKIHFTNVAVHKGSPEPNPVKRRFRADVRYWLMDANVPEHHYPQDGSETTLSQSSATDIAGHSAKSQVIIQIAVATTGNAAAPSVRSRCSSRSSTTVSDHLEICSH